MKSDTSPPQKITVYRPNQRRETGWIKTWILMVKNTWDSRDLIWTLFKRDLVGAYKKSFIRLTWLLIAPLQGIISWIFLWKTQMFDPGAMDIPYPVYVLMGQTMWQLFQGFYNSAGGTLSAGGNILKQVSYPHEALLFKQVASQMISFVLNLATNIAVMLLFGVTPSWGLLLFPFVAMPLFFLAASMGLIVSLIRVVSVDLNRFIGIGMRFLM